jgi:hypothetical protein
MQPIQPPQPVVAARDVLSVIVECGDWTGCGDAACQQRLAARGLQYRLEVFKTKWVARRRCTCILGRAVKEKAALVARFCLPGADARAEL